MRGADDAKSNGIDRCVPVPTPIRPATVDSVLAACQRLQVARGDRGETDLEFGASRMDIPNAYRRVRALNDPARRVIVCVDVDGAGVPRVQRALLRRLPLGESAAVQLFCSFSLLALVVVLVQRWHFAGQ